MLSASYEVSGFHWAQTMREASPGRWNKQLPLVDRLSTHYEIVLGDARTAPNIPRAPRKLGTQQNADHVGTKKLPAASEPCALASSCTTYLAGSPVILEPEQFLPGQEMSHNQISGKVPVLYPANARL
jgi:hypothetical protein